MEGYRGWYLTSTPEGTFLQSTSLIPRTFAADEGARMVWGSSTLEAVCKHGCEIGLCLRKHECSCGVYSLSTLARVLEQYPGLDIYGMVYNHGVVVEGMNGFRAEKCTVRALFTADIDLGRKLRIAYPDVAINFPPKEITDQTPHKGYQDAWSRTRSARKARLEAANTVIAAAKVKYPGGPTAEQNRILELMRGATRARIVEFCKEYGSSPDWLERNWLAKGENSRKAKPGEIVFEANDDTKPYVFIGSVRQRGGQSSIRWLMGRNGYIYRRQNIRRYYDENEFMESRQAAIDEWE